MRRADKTKTKRFTDPDGDWLELRTELDKDGRDAIAELNQNMVVDRADGATEIRMRVRESNRRLFEILIVGWSLKDESGEPIEPVADAYSSLDVESGEWVDECMTAVMSERRARAEKKDRSSKPRRSSRTTAARSGSKT